MNLDSSNNNLSKSKIEALDRRVFRGLSEDWTAVVVGLGIVVLALLVSLWTVPREVWNPAVEVQGQSSGEAKSATWESPLKALIGRPREWERNPLDGLRLKPSAKGAEPVAAGSPEKQMGSSLKPADAGIEEEKPKAAPWNFSGIVGVFGLCWAIGIFAMLVRGGRVRPFSVAFPVLFSLALLAYLIASQATIKYYGFEYALWALILGLFIANCLGTPLWLRPAVVGELYIKIGLVLLGAGLLFGKILELGLPGICVAWIVTPIVLVGTYLFGQYVLKIMSKTLNIVVSADMSVCGVSAAIATSAACRGKKEELSLAIALSLTFTVLMMVAMPPVIKWMGLDARVGGAWIGGTIDSTGAVAAAGEALGQEGSNTAVTIKMIQGILIGIVAFAVAVIWTKWIEPGEEAEKFANEARPPRTEVGLSEIWIRFPKFILGFLAASLLCSMISGYSTFGEQWVQVTVEGATKGLQGWLFCLAFVCIGLETNFRELWPYLKSGQALLLYVCGQSFNLILTLAMAYLMFGVLFR